MNEQAIVDVLKKRRRALKLTQVQVADDAGVTQPTLSAIETRRNGMALWTLLRLCKTLKLTITLTPVK